MRRRDGPSARGTAGGFGGESSTIAARARNEGSDDPRQGRDGDGGTLRGLHGPARGDAHAYDAAMAELKTQRTTASVTDFVAGVEPDWKQDDARTLLEMLSEVTGEKPAMWGDALIGFGSYDYRYATGNSGTWCRIGFSPRKRDMTVYLMDGTDNYGDELGRLGRHRLGKSCLYLPRLATVDLDVLREIATASWSTPSMGE